MKKRLMILGASHFQLAAIQCAKSAGHYVITCDYLPDNPGHRFGDEYYNVSSTDLAGVLDVARKTKIDGILAYASDPAAPTAAFVAEKLGLPGNSYAAVYTLTHKDEFRTFLKRHAFNCPRFQSFTDANEAKAFLATLGGKVVVKPVDSSGSKGVAVVRDAAELGYAFPIALSFSRARRVILEEFIQRRGFQIAGDACIQNGRIAFRGLAQEHFDDRCNPLAPIGESFPLAIDAETARCVDSTLQRLIDSIGLKMGAINLDIAIDERDNIYLLEVGPRSGGNWIPEVIECCYGVDLVQWSVNDALGLPSSSPPETPARGYFASYILHSDRCGIFEDIHVSPSILASIRRQSLFVARGDAVRKFANSGDAIGAIILQFDSHQDMLYEMGSMPDRVRVRLGATQDTLLTGDKVQ